MRCFLGGKNPVFKYYLNELGYFNSELNICHVNAICFLRGKNPVFKYYLNELGYFNSELNICHVNAIL
jgi:hypothetical protein